MERHAWLFRGAPEFDFAHGTPLLSAGKRAPNADFAAIGTGDIVHRRGQYQVYFAGSNAGGWTVGLLVSSDLQRWLSAGSVLSGMKGSFVQAGVQDPEAVVEGDNLELHYSGSSTDDSSKDLRARWQLGRAARNGNAICSGVDCKAGTDCGAGCGT
jgi:hypothetical protein